MSMKFLVENWRKFLSESNIVEQEQKDNYQKVLSYLKDKGLDVLEKPPANLIIKTEDRAETKQEIEDDLQQIFNFKFNDNAPGSSFGRFELQDRVGGSVFILLKPKALGAAGAGEDYEKRMAQTMQSLLPDFEIKTAGFGVGSDLSISGNGKLLKVELKTSSGADFGQFKLSYDQESGIWDTIKTKKFVENYDLFQGIFDSVVDPVIQGKTFSIKNDPSYNLAGNLVVGLVRSPNTLAVKQRLQKEIFGGNKSDLILPINKKEIQDYYALKGDSLVSIEGKGVYALTNEASNIFGIPELSDMITSARVRFRIKPHMGSTGIHSFTCSLKITLNKSPEKLDSQSFLQKIQNFLK